MSVTNPQRFLQPPTLYCVGKVSKKAVSDNIYPTPETTDIIFKPMTKEQLIFLLNSRRITDECTQDILFIRFYQSTRHIRDTVVLGFARCLISIFQEFPMTKR